MEICGVHVAIQEPWGPHRFAALRLDDRLYFASIAEWSKPILMDRTPTTEALPGRRQSLPGSRETRR